jgi:hypothetical protein
MQNAHRSHEASRPSSRAKAKIPNQPSSIHAPGKQRKLNATDIKKAMQTERAQISKKKTPFLVLGV